MTFERFTSDHCSFYRDHQPFYPLIQTMRSPLYAWSNSVRVSLSAAVHDDLDWSELKQEAERIIEAGKYLFWEIDFHLQTFSRFDSSIFFANVRAVEEVVRFILPQAFHTFGVCLYRGSLDLSPLFPFSEWEAPFFEWLEELTENSASTHELRSVESRGGEWVLSFPGAHYYRLFCMDCFSDYFHRLISFLPDGLLPFVFFDTTSVVSYATCTQLLSKKRFGHLHAACLTSKGIKLQINDLMRGWMGEEENAESITSDPSTALCLPSDPFCDRQTLHRLDAWIAANSDPFRILSEEKLTEEWEGVDQLILPSALSPQGMRKVLGFQAAGGEIIQN